MVNTKNQLVKSFDKVTNKDIKWIKIKGHIKSNSSNVISSNNILGKNDYFITGLNNIVIPENDASQTLLNFYGAELISSNDVFNLNYQKKLPLFHVSIGSDYVNGYLLKENYGDGFYIEKHDTPHYHQPLDENSNGFLILGKFIDDYLYLSKFKIPFGKAIYTPANIYHNDAFLIGNYNVIYTRTPNYSTLIFKNLQGQITQVK